MNKELYKYLVCPKCKTALVYSEEKIKLICKDCNRIYKIENDIPILLIEERDGAVK